MKIGILTHHYVNNFGAFLQTYALQEALKKMYPNDEVVVINAINIKHFIINTGGWFRFYKDRETLIAWKQKIGLPMSFYKARKQYLNMTRRCYSTKAINKLDLDCIVIGSDEVWNYQEGKGNATVKFGDGLNCRKIVAYAPSVGKSGTSQKVPTYISKGLRNFFAISSRDDMTEEFVTQILGKMPSRVLDPTFLADFPEEHVKNIKQPYVLFYYCDGLPAEMKMKIIEEAHRRGLAVYGAGEADKSYTDITINLSPFEWVDMFKNAQFVYTGTFHGVVFSILNHKQFQVYMTNKSRIRKITSLLRQFEIDLDKIDLSKDNSIFKKEINYDIVDKRICSLKADSIKFLECINQREI